MISLSISAVAAAMLLTSVGHAAEPTTGVATSVAKIELKAIPATRVRSRFKRDPQTHQVLRVMGTRAGGAAASGIRITVRGEKSTPRTIVLKTNGVAFLITRRTGRTLSLTTDGLNEAVRYRLSPRGGPSAPTGAVATTARVLAPVIARERPRFASKAVTVVQPIAPLGGGPTILLVRRSTRIDGRLWLRVVLPIRPNGSEGWIPADVVRMSKNRTRIIIRQELRRIDVYRSGKRVQKFRIAVGKAETPTPYGRFAIAEEIPTNIPGGFLGPFVLPLTGHSRVLNEYAGGNGRVAIHGTSEPQVIGTRASHGCIRLYNRDIRKLSAMVKPGTQVEIRRR